MDSVTGYILKVSFPTLPVTVTSLLLSVPFLIRSSVLPSYFSEIVWVGVYLYLPMPRSFPLHESAGFLNVITEYQGGAVK